MIWKRDKCTCWTCQRKEKQMMMTRECATILSMGGEREREIQVFIYQFVHYLIHLHQNKFEA